MDEQKRSFLELNAERYLVALLVHLVLNGKLQFKTSAKECEKREGAKGRNGSDRIDRWTDLARSSNGNRLSGFVTSRGLDIFHGVDNVHTLKNMSKDDLSGNQKLEQNSIFRQTRGLC